MAAMAVADEQHFLPLVIDHVISTRAKKPSQLGHRGSSIVQYRALALHLENHCEISNTIAVTTTPPSLKYH